MALGKSLAWVHLGGERHVGAVVREGDVLIATLDDVVRDMATRLFTRAGFATVDVTTGEAALSSALRRRPSLVLLDLQLADMTGYEVCYELRERAGPDIPIIFVSADRTEPSDRVAGLLIGADDYLSKPFDPDELLARARRVLARSPAPTRTMDTPLTGREIQVLQLLADGSNQDAIAKELFISSKTVATHIQRILTKLDVHSRTEAVALAYREGLVRDPNGSRGSGR
jgi:DNA-binding NarL/FixJ family response regulator